MLLAPHTADLLHDPALTTPLRLAAGVVVCYALYAVFVGTANGARAFHKQALLDFLFSTLRASFVVCAAMLTHSALAALGGFVAAAATILVVAFFVVGVGAGVARSRFPPRSWSRFFRGVAIYLLIVNLLMFVDGFCSSGWWRSRQRRRAAESERGGQHPRRSLTARCRRWRAFPISSSWR